MSDLSTSDGGSGFPSLLAPVTVHLDLPDGAGADAPSVVCDIEDADGTQQVVVGRPDLSGVHDAGTYPHRGEELTLMWSMPSGQMQLRVTAVAALRPYGPVWLLTPVSVATREQRRQYFRVPLTLQAVLTPIVDGVADEESVSRATLVEISEGGALICSDQGLPEVGSVIELAFTLDDRKIDAQAEVLRHKSMPNGRPAAALRFLDPAAYGDHIRRFAFAMQRTRARTRLT